MKYKYKATRQRRCFQVDPDIIERIEALEEQVAQIEDLERRLDELEAMLPGREATAMKAKRIRAEVNQLSAQRAGRPLVQAEDVQGLTRIHAAVRRKVLAHAGKNYN